MSQGVVLLEQRLRTVKQQLEEGRNAISRLRDEIKTGLADFLANWFRTAPRSYLGREPDVQAGIPDEDLRALRERTTQLALRAEEFVRREFDGEEAWRSLPKAIGGGSPETIQSNYGLFYHQLGRIAGELDSVMHNAGFRRQGEPPRLPTELCRLIKNYVEHVGNTASLERAVEDLEKQIAQRRAADRWDQL